MKTTPVRFILLIVAFALAGLSSRAEPLSQILVNLGSLQRTGAASDEAVTAARLTLYFFRRDTAGTTGEKIKNQEAIVQVFEKKLESARARSKSGLATSLEILTATASVLEAKQTLAELQPAEKKT